VRQGDLVARWGEDEFLVAGLGDRPDADHGPAHRARVQESGVNLGKWPTTRSARPQAIRRTTFDVLVLESAPVPYAISHAVA
jgi:hypothetical protein